MRKYSEELEEISLVVTWLWVLFFIFITVILIIYLTL